MATQTTSGSDAFYKQLGRMYATYTGGFVAFVILLAKQRIRRQGGMGLQPGDERCGARRFGTPDGRQHAPGQNRDAREFRAALRKPCRPEP